MGKFTNGIKSILTTFMNWLPSEGDRQLPTDSGNVAKTSPWLFDYDVFRINWEKVATLREIDRMMDSDPRLKRANHVFATTAIRRGLTVKVSSKVSEALGQQAQDILDEMVKSTELNSKLKPWARSLSKDGEIFLNPIIDVNEMAIIDIKNLPAITMQRNEDIQGRFPDRMKAFRQIDPVSREVLTEFPLYAINHIRWDHEPGQLYGRSLYLTGRNIYRKLNMIEEDLVVRRRTRAVPRRFHNVGNKDNPSDWSEVETYKQYNKLDNPKSTTVLTDYFGNGMTDVKDLTADSQQDHIKDVEYFQELLMISTFVPLHILGFGKNVNRDIVEDQKKQFDEDTQEMRDLLEYGDESSYSGLRSIFDLALRLKGIDPDMVEYNLIWADSNNETISDKVDRMIKMRASQPEPLVSRQFALEYLGRDIGLENPEAVLAEIERIKEEMTEARQEAMAMQQMLNPEKPSAAPISKGTTNSAGKVTTDSTEESHPLRSAKVLSLEKSLADDIRRFFRAVKKRMQANGMEAKVKEINRLRSIQDHSEQLVTVTLSPDAVLLMNPHAGCSCTSCLANVVTDVKLNRFVEQNVLDQFDDAWAYADENDHSFSEKLTEAYSVIAEYAFQRAAEDDAVAGIKVGFNFVNSGIVNDLKDKGGYRIRRIQETTRQMLGNQLAQAYENAEDVASWMKRINSVLDIPDWRAETIARTELSWAYNQANEKAYRDGGVTRVKWLAVVDSHTCPTCKGRNGEVYDLEDLPNIPAHPRCRCTTVAIL